MTPFMGHVVNFCDFSTVALCVVCKIPQIVAIWKAKSVEGLSEKSLALELLTYVISLSYNAMNNYPLSTYLEDPFLAIQSLIVLLIVYSYNDNLDRNKMSAIVGLSGVFYALSYGIPHPYVLQALLTATLPMKVFSKLLQLAEIWKAKSAGNISLVSWGINIYTCLTRILTTIVVTNDMIVLMKHTLSVTLNLAVIGTALWFRGNEKTDAKKK